MGVKIQSFIVRDNRIGINKVVWDTIEFPSGLYFAEIESTKPELEVSSILKMILMK
jgi:hypothetical protein